MKIFDITLLGIHISPSYYGLMYALGFLIGYYIIKNRINSPLIPLNERELKNDKLDDLLIYIVIGVVLGGRLGYILFYNFSKYLENPLEIFKVWEGGMSFHGGIIGVVIAMILFSKIHKVNFYKLADQISLVVPIGLGLGRIGNYLNGELLGYSGYNGLLNINGKFPSPLVEALLEGLIILIILNYIYIKKITPPPSGTPLGKWRLEDGQIASIFLILYGIFRIFVEAAFRKPDLHIGYIWNYFTLGEIYSLPMIIIGIFFYYKLKK